MRGNDERRRDMQQSLGRGPFKEPDASAPRQAVVGEHQIKRRVAEMFEAFLRRARRGDGKPGDPEQGDDQLTKVIVVFDEKNGRPSLVRPRTKQTVGFVVLHAGTLLHRGPVPRPARKVSQSLAILLPDRQRMDQVVELLCFRGTPDGSRATGYVA